MFYTPTPWIKKYIIHEYVYGVVSFLRDCLEIIGDQPKDPGEKKSDILASIYLIRGYGRIYSRRKRIGAENVLPADLFCWEPQTLSYYSKSLLLAQAQWTTQASSKLAMTLLSEQFVFIKRLSEKDSNTLWRGNSCSFNCGKYNIVELEINGTHLLGCHSNIPS